MNPLHFAALHSPLTLLPPQPLLKWFPPSGFIQSSIWLPRPLYLPYLHIYQNHLHIKGSSIPFWWCSSRTWCGCSVRNIAASCAHTTYWDMHSWCCYYCYPRVCRLLFWKSLCTSLRPIIDPSRFVKKEDWGIYGINYQELGGYLEYP